MTWPHVGELAALATAVLWTFSALAWTAAGKHVGALAVSFIRLLIACGLMILYSRVVRGLWLPTDADARTWLVLGASGILGFFLSDLCMLKAFLLIVPRLSLLVGSLTPPIAAIFSWVWIGDQLRCADCARCSVIRWVNTSAACSLASAPTLAIARQSATASASAISDGGRRRV